jgi:phytanoyl-CoA hydroxylase
MIELSTPNGLRVDVPETLEEDPSPHFALEDLEAARRYYDDEGYVVISGLLERSICDELRALWDAEVKPSPRPIYRQATAKLETHTFNANGWVMNPILNLQSLDPRRFGRLRRAAIDKVFNTAPLTRALTGLIGDRPKIVQSMYFEGNSATWEHQDSYYLDSEQIGSMAAAWIALEDIASTAGRFFVCPKSHRLAWERQTSSDNIADKHDVYIAKVVEKYRRSNLAIRAPALKAGEVLFWNAFTIHGSLASQDAHRARSSITCHVIPDAHRFLQLQSRVIDVPSLALEHVSIYAPKDAARFKNRAVAWIEWHFPRLFYWAKASAVKLMVARRARADRAAVISPQPA